MCHGERVWVLERPADRRSPSRHSRRRTADALVRFPTRSGPERWNARTLDARRLYVPRIGRSRVSETKRTHTTNGQGERAHHSYRAHRDCARRRSESAASSAQHRGRRRRRRGTKRVAVRQPRTVSPSTRRPDRRVPRGKSARVHHGTASTGRLAGQSSETATASRLEANETRTSRRIRVAPVVSDSTGCRNPRRRLHPRSTAPRRRRCPTGVPGYRSAAPSGSTSGAIRGRSGRIQDRCESDRDGPDRVSSEPVTTVEPCRNTKHQALLAQQKFW